MKIHTIVAVCPMVALLLVAGNAVQAQPKPGGPRPNHMGPRRMEMDPAEGPRLLQGRMLERLLGKPLTPAQKQKVKAAAIAYNASVARAVGMTPAQLEKKRDEMRRKFMMQRPQRPGGAPVKH